MIVVATHNGKKYLEDLLSDFKRIGVKKQISIIDTQSDDQESLEFLNSLDNENIFNLDIKIYKTPYRGFDTGAYIYALNNLKSDRFYFMQDSIKIKLDNYFDEIDSKLKFGTVVPLITFDENSYLDDEQISFCKSNFNEYKFSKGIFGPIFSIMYEDIQKIDKKYLVYPTNKNEQMAMERGWAIIFEKYDFEIESLEGHLDPNKLVGDGYNFFKKHLPYRR